MKHLLWLDDIRDPFKDNWIRDFSPIGVNCETIWVKNYKQFIFWIQENGLPSAICFDHDLENFHITKSTYNGKGKS